MSSLLLLIPAALLIVAAQATLIERLTLVSGHPDLIIASLLLLTVQAGRERVYLLAVLIAPLFDALSGLPLGTSVLPLLAVVYLAGTGERALFGFRLGWPIVVAVLASVMAGMITLLELSFLGWTINWPETVIRILFPSALLNALLVFLLYFPAQYLRERRILGMGAN